MALHLCKVFDSGLQVCKFALTRQADAGERVAKLFPENSFSGTLPVASVFTVCRVSVGVMDNVDTHTHTRTTENQK